MSKELTVQKAVIEVGLEKPIRLLHMTDSHIDVKQVETEEVLINCEYFEAALAYARERELMVLHTGDMMNDSRETCRTYTQQQIKDLDMMLMLGNHDLVCYPGSPNSEDPEHEWQYLERLAPYFSQNLYFESRIIGGVNFVMLNDVYYRITMGQAQMLRAEAAKGYPVILCLHVPLFDKAKADMMLDKGRYSGYMAATPPEYYNRYNEKYRLQQTPTAETLEAVDYIKKIPGIKAIIAGHTHENFDGILDCGLRQITTGAVKDGYVREITII